MHLARPGRAPVRGAAAPRLGEGARPRRDVTADAGEVTRLRNSAAELHKQATTLRQQLVAQLVDGGVPIRDIGTVVNVSYQRVEQIVQQGAPVAKTEIRAAAPHSGTTTRTKTYR